MTDALALAFIGKAERAPAAARLLLEAGDTEGSCSRLQDVRIRADDMAGAPSAEEPDGALAQAEGFVATMRERFFPD